MTAQAADKIVEILRSVRAKRDSKRRAVVQACLDDLCSKLYASIPDHRNGVEFVDYQTKEIEYLVSSLPEELARRKQMLRKRRNDLLPIHALPTELLIYIFDLSTSSASGRVTRLLELSTVSVTWRKVLAAASGLWTEIEIGEPGFVLASTKRSKNRLLNVTWSRDWPNGPPGYGMESAVVLGTAARWKALRLSVASGLATIERAEPSFDALESVEIDVVRGTASFLRAAHNLRSVTLSGVTVGWESIWLPNFRAFSVSNVEQISVTWVVDHLLFLSRHDTLDEVVFRRLGHGGMYDVDGPTAAHSILGNLDLPALRTLRLLDVESDLVVDLLKCLRGEWLTVLAIDGERDEEDVWDDILPELGSGSSLVRTVCKNVGTKPLVVTAHPDALIIEHEGEGLHIRVAGWWWIEEIEFIINPFRLESVASEVQLNLFHRAIDDFQPFDIDPTFLDRTPGITEINISNLVDVRWVLYHLSSPAYVERGAGWPCPKLKRVQLPGYGYFDLYWDERVAMHYFAEYRSDVEIYLNSERYIP